MSDELFKLVGKRLQRGAAADLWVHSETRTPLWVPHRCISGLPQVDQNNEGHVYIKLWLAKKERLLG